ncbi:hypothetical protein M0R45_005992 [Rubus argutus]|uniref:Uncharacterized protein n=1 Tax=Rubus argutus TaxID=59490 RepID=A0AAW1YPB3_RUBAR
MLSVLLRHHPAATAHSRARLYQICHRRVFFPLPRPVIITSAQPLYSSPLSRANLPRRCRSTSRQQRRRSSLLYRCNQCYQPVQNHVLSLPMSLSSPPSPATGWRKNEKLKK